MISASLEYVKNVKKTLENEQVIFITSHLHREYTPFAADFGPVSLGILHRFCSAMAKRLSKTDEILYIYCVEPTFACRANACFLLSAYMMLLEGWNFDKACATFKYPNITFFIRPFRDASYFQQDFDLTLQDCLKGLSQSVSLGWYHPRSFDRRAYDRLGLFASGGVHEICPKLVAFKGPIAAGSVHRLEHEAARPPSEYAPVLRRLGVTCVVRLNETDTYDRWGPPPLPPRNLHKARAAFNIPT